MSGEPDRARRHPDVDVAFRAWLYEGPLFTQYVLRHVAEAVRGVDHTAKQESDFYEAMSELLRMSKSVQIATASIDRAVSKETPS